MILWKKKEKRGALTFLIFNIKKYKIQAIKKVVLFNINNNKQQKGDGIWILTRTWKIEVEGYSRASKQRKHEMLL